MADIIDLAEGVAAEIGDNKCKSSFLGVFGGFWQVSRAKATGHDEKQR